MHRIPGDSLDSSNGRLVQTLDSERSDFIKCGEAVLESIISCPGCRAERLPTSLALVATTLPPPGLVEAVGDNLSGSGFFQRCALAVWTAGTLHGFWTPVDGGTAGLKLSLKLYHESKLQVGDQQSIAEAPSA